MFTLRLSIPVTAQKPSVLCKGRYNDMKKLRIKIIKKLKDTILNKIISIPNTLYSLLLRRPIGGVV